MAQPLAYNAPMERAFGPYRLLRRIASGGMGEVWLAVLEREGGFEKTVALKTILPQLAERADFAARFEREAACAALLSHPNLVQVFDFGRLDGCSYLTMEYVAGADLASCIAARGEQPWPPAVVCELAVQLCRGLAHAHGCRDHQGRPAGLVHGDVSPANVLLSSDGVAKLADFGLARLRSTGATGELAGKPAYMSPEQAAGELAGPASDLYALGLVLFELLTGQRARPAAASAEEAFAIARSGRLTDRRRTAVAVEPGLAAVLDSTLAPAAADRPASAGTLAEALLRACPPAGPEALATAVAELRPAAPAPEPTEVAARPVVGHRGPGRRWLGGLFGLLGLGWALGFGWWWLHPPPPDRPRPPAALDLAPAAAAADGTDSAAAGATAAGGRTDEDADQDPEAGDATAAAGRDTAAAGDDTDAAADQDAVAAGDDTDADAGQDAAAADGTEAAAAYTGPRASAPALLAAQAPADPGSRPAAGSDPAAAPDARPAAAPLELQLSAGLRTELDHQPVAGRRLRLDRDRAHLLRLVSAGGPAQEVLLRLAPAGAGWELAVRARPWLRIRLAGRPAGQTPRHGLRIGPGRTVLELNRGPQRLRLELVAAERREEP